MLRQQAVFEEREETKIVPSRRAYIEEESSEFFQVPQSRKKLRIFFLYNSHKFLTYSFIFLFINHIFLASKKKKSYNFPSLRAYIAGLSLEFYEENMKKYVHWKRSRKNFRSTTGKMWRIKLETFCGKETTVLLEEC